jgi:hypothetical protein
MTVADLSERMTLDEEAGWLEYYELQEEDRKRAIEEAKSKARSP